MSTLNFTRLVLVCDGCKKRHGEPHGHGSAREARLAAYLDGWRFPATVLSDGRPGNAASDVCPECLPRWEPQHYHARPGRSTHLTIDNAPRAEEAP